jgi:hypothetical protein
LAGDPLRLRQVIWHLLSNAIKFTPSAGRIEVAVVQIGEELELTVTDTGEGIPPAFLPHVFEHFSQSDGSSTRRHGGMGLGLAVVRHLTELHGGTVSAESAGTHRGARFVARFPLPSEMTTADLEETTPMEPGVLRGLRVAVIDDEPDVTAIVSTVLGLCGAEVRTIRPGDDEALLCFAPDVVITSAALPSGLSGAVAIGLDKPIEPLTLVSRITRVMHRAA